MRVATLANAGHDRRRCRLGSAIATSSMQCATPSRRAQQAKTDLTRFDRVKNLNMGSFHIHLRGFFSSITAQVAAAVIPPSATSSKTSSGVPIGVILSNYRFLDALISIPKHESTNSCPKNAGRCPKNDIRAGRLAGGLRSQKTLTDNLVQKLLVESGYRMSQRRDDFLLIALASGQPMAAHLQLPRKKAPNPTDQHIGSRVRMRRKMLAMSQEQLAEALGITYQQVQKISHILQVPVTFFFEGAPNAAAPHDSSGSALSMAQIDDFVSDSNGLRLMRAFMRIDSAALRRRIAMLVQEIAGDDD